MIKINQKQKSGYAVLELLFYIALFAVLSLVVIDAMVAMARSFRETAIQSELTQGGFIMERITREIRASYGINSISVNDLKLNTKDDAGTNKTVEFLLSGSNVRLLENDIVTGNLNTPQIIATGLDFSEITTTNGKAVKIILTLQSLNDKSNRIINFYDTVVLRGSY